MTVGTATYVGDGAIGDGVIGEGAGGGFPVQWAGEFPLMIELQKHDQNPMRVC